MSTRSRRATAQDRAWRLRAGALGIGLILSSCDGTDGVHDPGSAGAARPSQVPETVPEQPADIPDAVAEALDTEHVSVVVRPRVEDLAVRSAPGDSAAVTHRVDRMVDDHGAVGGQPVEQVLLVTDQKRGDDRRWLRVLLPVRPNGTTGWVDADEVTVTQHDFAVTVDIGAHRITTTKGGEVVQSTDIAVGTADTPTPGGLFYLVALLQPPDRDTVYGSFAYALSGYSETLESYAGGDGVIGIHGTNDPSVIGTDVSHGCIRMTNSDIEFLAERLPLGAPVTIVA